MKILIVEDEPNLRAVLKKRLEVKGYFVHDAENGLEALEWLKVDEFDLIISDIMMPKLNGYELLEALKTKGIDIPILFLSAKDTTEDIVKGLDLGADDYMVKPFDFSELLARIRMLTRRKLGSKSGVVTVGDMEILCEERIAKRGGKEIQLSNREYELLMILVKNKNKVISRERISSAIYDFDYVESNTIDVYIRFLRKKIDEGFENKIIHTIRGVGYMVKD